MSIFLVCWDPNIHTDLTSAPVRYGYDTLGRFWVIGRHRRNLKRVKIAVMENQPLE